MKRSHKRQGNEEHEIRNDKINDGRTFDKLDENTNKILWPLMNERWNIGIGLERKPRR